MSVEVRNLRWAHEIGGEEALKGVGSRNTWTGNVEWETGIEDLNGN